MHKLKWNLPQIIKCPEQFTVYFLSFVKGRGHNLT